MLAENAVHFQIYKHSFSFAQAQKVMKFCYFQIYTPCVLVAFA